MLSYMLMSYSVLCLLRFDVLGVDPDATTYDYGFKKKADGAGEVSNVPSL